MPITSDDPVALTSSLSEVWEKLGATKEFNPPPPEYCRYAVIGGSKMGKTTLMAGIPGGLVLDMEGGAHSVPNPQAFKVWVAGYSPADISSQVRKVAQESGRTPVALTEVLTQLEKDAKSGNPQFTHVIFDSTDQLQEFVIGALSREVGKDIREHGHKGKGISMVVERCMTILKKVYSLGYGYSTINHMTVKTITIGGVEHEKYRATIFPSLYSSIKADTDYILAIEKKTGYDPKSKTQKTSYDLRTTSTRSEEEDLELGGRIVLPPRIKDLSQTHGWEQLRQVYEQEVSRLKSELASQGG